MEILVSLSSLLVTVVLAILTSIYVWLTHKMLRVQSDPCVIVSVILDEGNDTIFQLVIQNVGRSVANDVRFESSQPIPYHAFGFDPEEAPEAKKITRGPFITGIPALGPGETRKMIWGQYGGLKKALGDGQIRITCRFCAGNRKCCPTVSVLDIRSFESSDVMDPDGARKCAKQLERIAGDIEKGISLLSPLSVTLTKKQSDGARQFPSVDDIIKKAQGKGDDNGKNEDTK